jgi:hypothetical protein
MKNAVFSVTTNWLPKPAAGATWLRMAAGASHRHRPMGRRLLRDQYQEKKLFSNMTLVLLIVVERCKLLMFVSSELR